MQIIMALGFLGMAIQFPAVASALHYGLGFSWWISVPLSIFSLTPVIGTAFAVWGVLTWKLPIIASVPIMVILIMGDTLFMRKFIKK